MAVSERMAASPGENGTGIDDKQQIMPKMRKKADLPEKICEACGRPFVWRKKWAKVWDEVKTCSERCKLELRRRRREA